MGTIQIKRGSGQPSSLLYGEMAFDNLNNLLYVGEENSVPTLIGGNLSNHFSTSGYTVPLQHGGTGLNSITADRVIVSTSGSLSASSITTTQLGYLSGVTSSVQTQIDGKSAISHAHNYALSNSAGGPAASVGFTIDNISTIYLGGTVASNTTAPKYNNLVYMTGNTLTATTFIGNLNGNAATATSLQTSRTIATSGGAIGTATAFNGTANISIPITALNASYLSSGTVPISVIPVGLVSGTVSPGDHGHQYAASTYGGGPATTVEIASAAAGETIYLAGCNATATTTLKKHTTVRVQDGNLYAGTFYGVFSGSMSNAVYANSAGYLSVSTNFRISGGVTAANVAFNGQSPINLSVTAVDPAYLSTNVPVNKGGTGSNTASGGLTNLGIFYAATLPNTGVAGQICLVPA